MYKQYANCRISNCFLPDKTQIILDKLCHSLSSGILESTENFLIVIENYGKRENDIAIVRLVKDIREDAHSQGVRAKTLQVIMMQ